MRKECGYYLYVDESSNQKKIGSGIVLEGSQDKIVYMIWIQDIEQPRRVQDAHNMTTIGKGHGNTTYEVSKWFTTHSRTHQQTILCQRSPFC